MKIFLIEEENKVLHLKKEFNLILFEVKKLRNDFDFFSNPINTKSILDNQKLLIFDKTNIEADLHNLTNNIAQFKNRLKKISIELKSLKSRLPNFLRDKVKLTAEKEKASQKKYFENRLNDLYLEYEKKNNLITDLYEDIKKNTVVVDKLNKFSGSACSQQIISLETRLIKIQEELNINEFVLKELKDNLSKDIERLNNLIIDFNNIEEQEQELSCSNSYERKQIHENLENYYGSGNAKHLKIKFRNEIIPLQKKINSTIEKIRKNTLYNFKIDIIKRNCRRLIIDGNNFLYNTSNKNVGSAPLLYLVNYLMLNYDYNITVVYDQSFQDEQIEVLKEALPTKVKVTIAKDHQTADDLIVNLGNNDNDTYIISNDNFDDYSTNEIITEKRLIKHYISDGLIEIPLLNIALEF